MYMQNGLGDANCPSMQQLAGISDPNDPCQGFPIPGSSPLVPDVSVCYPTSFVGPLPAGGSYCSTPPGASSSSSPSTIIAGVPDRAVYTIGGLLAAFILLGIVHK